MKNVCFTGHRNSPHTPQMRFYIKNLLEGLIVLDGADTFYTGGAKGWDNDCSDIVLEMQKKYPHIKLSLVLPYPENIQTDGWTVSEKEQYRRIVSRAINVEFCSEKKIPDSEKIRNARLVELADCCVCYLILISNQPVDKYVGYNEPTLRQTTLTGDSPSAVVFLDWTHSIRHLCLQNNWILVLI